MRFRTINRAIAFVGGFFWLPCPECGQYFGGHEWQMRTDKPIANANAEGICHDCIESNKGSWPTFTLSGGAVAQLRPSRDSE